MTTESLQDSINEFYKLKSKYESDIEKNKTKILRNKNLSIKEKKSEFKKLKPKCVNCKRPGGTLFSSKYIPENYENKKTNEGFRQLKAVCGILADPCNLNITVNVGSITMIPQVLKEVEKEIIELKNSIIDDKNKLLFGLITTEQALDKFNDMKELIQFNTSKLQLYLDEYHTIIDNKTHLEDLRINIEKSYELIIKIKECVKNYNVEDNTQYINDVVSIYDNELNPLLKTIMDLKYKEKIVWYKEDTNTFHLIQKKYGITDLEYNQGEPEKVVSYDVGLRAASVNPPKKKLLIVESDEEESET